MVYAPEDRAEDIYLPPSQARLWLASLWRDVARAIDAQWQNRMLWLPVFFACGIILYFSLQTEPGVAQSLVPAGIAACLLILFRRSDIALVLMGVLLCLSLGFAAAKVSTERNRAPVVTEETRFAHLGGWVEEVERRDGKRDRILLRVFSMEKREPQQTPYRVRISISRKASSSLATGDAISLWATLLPPPQPAAPGHFDFARKAWFMQLGALGFVTSRITPLEAAPEAPFSIRLWTWIDRIRTTINGRIDASLDGEQAGLAKALITGDRGGISEEVEQAMRDSGLAHVLSISGLHMMLMGGALFWIVRGVLACIPGIALRSPIKKWAAAASLIAALFYLAISGAELPTIRSWIMMSIVMVAVILDRPAITMRNVAIAAFLMLLIAPESVFDPSFQMSFSAVIGLVAVYEAMARRKKAPQAGDVSRTWRGLRFAWLSVWAAALTTTVAGFATAPYAAYHFNRVAYYSLAANLLAAPIIGLVIMPMALLSVIAMPFHLEQLPLIFMGYGLDAMVWAGTTVSEWPGAISIVPSMSGLSLFLIVAGGLWICLWQGIFRQAGWIAIIIGLYQGAITPRPDLLIEREGKTIAVRGDDGRLALLPGSQRSYSAQKWLQADGDSRDPAEAASRDDFTCDSLGCLTDLVDRKVAFLTEPGAAEEDCREVAILIAQFYVPKACAGPEIIVDRQTLKEQGAQALYLEDKAIRIETVAETRGRRPWTATTQPRKITSTAPATDVKTAGK